MSLYDQTLKQITGKSVDENYRIIVFDFLQRQVRDV